MQFERVWKGAYDEREDEDVVSGGDGRDGGALGVTRPTGEASHSTVTVYLNHEFERVLTTE